VGWLLVSQSFLFSPLAFSLRPDGALWLRVMIPVIGVGICLTLLPGIRAAADTLRVFLVRDRVLMAQHSELLPFDPDHGTPKRNEGTFRRSVSYVKWLPVALFIVWVAVLTIVLVDLAV
jgi:hypothetical protein